MKRTMQFVDLFMRYGVDQMVAELEEAFIKKSLID